MKKLILTLLVMVLFASGLLAGCGPVRTQTYNFTDFTRVEVGYAFHVEVVQSDSYSVSITANEDIFNNIQVSQEGETLKIHLTQSATFGTRKAEITMPDLRAINLSRAAKGTIKGFSSSGDFTLDLSGASSLDGDLTAGDVDFHVAGASHVKLADFSVRNADVTLRGASSGTVNLSGKLDADLSGASHLEYVGEPTLGTINTSGSSTLRKK